MVKILQCSTWKFVLDVLHLGYKPEYLLAMSYCLEKSRAIRMLQNAVGMNAISRDEYAQFIAVLEKRQR